MYGSGIAAGSVTAAALLPVTGFNILWYAVAGFTLVSAGLAVLRLVPRRSAS